MYAKSILDSPYEVRLVFDRYYNSSAGYFGGGVHLENAKISMTFVTFENAESKLGRLLFSTASAAGSSITPSTLIYIKNTTNIIQTMYNATEAGVRFSSSLKPYEVS